MIKQLKRRDTQLWFCYIALEAQGLKTNVYVFSSLVRKDKQEAKGLKRDQIPHEFKNVVTQYCITFRLHETTRLLSCN